MPRPLGGFFIKGGGLGFQELLYLRSRNAINSMSIEIHDLVHDALIPDESLHGSP